MSKIKLTELYMISESYSFAPNKQIEDAQVQAKMPEAYSALEVYGKETLGYPDLHMFIFVTDKKGTMWALNDVNLLWDGTKWNDMQDDTPEELRRG